MNAEREVDENAPVDPLDSTAFLIARVREGDERARDRLAVRYRAALIRWAHGRLPNRVRGLVDTEDMVQSALYRAMARIDGFEPRGEGAFLAYVRQILLNQIRDEGRRAGRTPEHTALDDRIAGEESSPLERVIRSEQLERYERALSELNPVPREAIVLRLELGFRYREIAEALGLPSGNAARLVVARAIVHLMRAMKGRT